MQNSKIKSFYFNDWNHHFFGWTKIVNFLNESIKSYEKSPTYLDVAFEKHWIYDKNMDVINHCKSNPWIAFVHHPHNQRENHLTMSYNLKHNKFFKDSIKNLKGIFTVCETQASDYRKLPELQNIPISTILHPGPPNMKQFSVENFNDTIVTMGQHMRNNQILNNFDTGNIKKKFLKGVSNEEYENALSESAVFQNYVNCTASNVICECIASCTPIVVNKLPAIVEYLGEDYPLYYDSLQEAEDKIKNLNILIGQANQYLIELNKRRPLTLDKFVDDIFQSEVYKNL